MTNGEVVTVSGVNDTGGIELEDGRVLPSGYRQLQHGYAVTAHRNGKTADSVIISADAMKKELFYVSASRARESITIVTSDKELLGGIRSAAPGPGNPRWSWSDGRRPDAGEKCKAGAAAGRAPRPASRGRQAVACSSAQHGCTDPA